MKVQSVMAFLDLLSSLPQLNLPAAVVEAGCKPASPQVATGVVALLATTPATQSGG
jgi:hypothetical protein